MLWKNIQKRNEIRKITKITEKHKQLVLEIRKKHPKLGKEKIKALLDKLCKQHNIPAISASSIGNIIKILKEERKLNHEHARQRISINGTAGS
jgi:hypothetical protein